MEISYYVWLCVREMYSYNDDSIQCSSLYYISAKSIICAPKLLLILLQTGILLCGFHHTTDPKNWNACPRVPSLHKTIQLLELLFLRTIQAGIELSSSCGTQSSPHTSCRGKGKGTIGLRLLHFPSESVSVRDAVEETCWGWGTQALEHGLCERGLTCTLSSRTLFYQQIYDSCNFFF